MQNPTLLAITFSLKIMTVVTFYAPRPAPPPRNVRQWLTLLGRFDRWVDRRCGDIRYRLLP